VRSEEKIERRSETRRRTLLRKAHFKKFPLPTSFGFVPLHPGDVMIEYIE
jgi:hypothetical protein